MSTPEQHRALFLEIISEMTPEQLAEALKPQEIDCHINLSYDYLKQFRKEMSDRTFYNLYHNGFHLPENILIVSV